MKHTRKTSDITMSVRQHGKSHSLFIAYRGFPLYACGMTGGSAKARTFTGGLNAQQAFEMLLQNPRFTAQMDRIDKKLDAGVVA